MSDTGYTIIKQGHICPKPINPIGGTIIRCDSCGKHWSYGPLGGWFPASAPKEGE